MGTLIGVLIVGFLGNGLNLAGVEPFWQYVAQGIVLVFAVALDRFVNIGVLALSTGKNMNVCLKAKRSQLKKHLCKLIYEKGDQNGKGF